MTTLTKEELLRELAAAEREHPTTRIRMPSDVVPMLARYSRRRQECFLAVSLDGAHQVIRTREITRGLANRTMVHAREVFRGAIRDNAVALILAHNHPSGSVEPSDEDKSITRALTSAGDVIGIPVLDHVIISRTGYYSFLENDELRS